LLKYFVKIMDDHFERKGAMASQIPKSIRWSYDTNFKLMVIKHAMLSGSLVTTAWRVLRLWMEEKASRCGG
jgi:hypothetical protein